MTRTPVSLLERLRDANDADAWNGFVRLYTPLLFFWARRVGLQDSDAADLLQDVFVVLHRRMPEFVYEPGKSFRAWLRSVTLNQWRNRKKKMLAQPVAELEVEVADPILELEEAEYQRHLMRRALEIVKSDFAPGTWTAWWESVVARRSAADIARELNMSVDAVYAAKFRVLQRLREELKGLWD